MLPRLCIDVVQFCTKFASCHSAEKAKFIQPWSWQKIWLMALYPCHDFFFFLGGGRTSLLLPRLIWLLYPTVSLLCPRRGSIKRWCASDVWLSVYLFVVCLTSLWCLSVAYIGAEVAHVTRDSATTFEVKKIKGQGQRTKTRWPYHTVLKGWRYSLTFRHNINIGRSDGQTDMPCEYDIHTR